MYTFAGHCQYLVNLITIQKKSLKLRQTHRERFRQFCQIFSVHSSKNLPLKCEKNDRTSNKLPPIYFFGHVECSFQNLAIKFLLKFRNFSPEVRKYFAPSRKMFFFNYNLRLFSQQNVPLTCGNQFWGHQANVFPLEVRKTNFRKSSVKILCLNCPSGSVEVISGSTSQTAGILWLKLKYICEFSVFSNKSDQNVLLKKRFEVTTFSLNLYVLIQEWARRDIFSVIDTEPSKKNSKIGKWKN